MVQFGKKNDVNEKTFETQCKFLTVQNVRALEYARGKFVLLQSLPRDQQVGVSLAVRFTNM